MARMGFIQDKLEIKFLLLYIASRLIEPVPFEAMQELAMIDDGVDFFDFSECMNDLVTSGHLTLSEDGLYAITEKGLRNGQICESSLPYSVRLAADKNITVFNQKLRSRRMAFSSIVPLQTAQPASRSVKRPRKSPSIPAERSSACASARSSAVTA